MAATEQQEVNIIGGYVTATQLWLHIETLVQIMYTMQWNMTSHPCEMSGEIAPGVRCRCGCVVLPPASHTPARERTHEMQATPSEKPAFENIDAPAAQESWSTPRRTARMAKLQRPQRQTQHGSTGFHHLTDDYLDAEEPTVSEASSGAAASLPPPSNGSNVEKTRTWKTRRVHGEENMSDEDILTQAYAEAQAGMRQPPNNEVPSDLGGSAPSSPSMSEVESTAGMAICFEPRSNASERHRSSMAVLASAAGAIGGHCIDEGKAASKNTVAGVAASYGHYEGKHVNNETNGIPLGPAKAPPETAEQLRARRKQELIEELDVLAGRR